MLEKKYELDDLFIVHVGIKSSGTTYAKETIICKVKEDGMRHKLYKDIFTNNIYRLSNDYYTNIGDAVVFNPMSLISVFKPSKFKDKLLEQGYATKQELISLYNALNDENGHVIVIEKLKLDEPNGIIVLNKKAYPTPPAYFKDTELEALMISLALNKKITLITGENGIGKTSLMDQLAYLIQHNQVPDFLRKKAIFEINIPKLNTSKTKKELEREIKNIIDYAKAKEAILFLDDADQILEANENNINAIALLRFAAERENLKIVATINKENLKQDTTIKNQFDIIEIKEPDETQLIEIAKKVFLDESKKTNIKIKLNEINENFVDIITILIGSTYSSKINFITSIKNPGLLLQIITTSFAVAQSKNAKYLEYSHLITALENNINLDKQQVSKAINILNELQYTPPNTEKRKQLLQRAKN